MVSTVDGKIALGGRAKGLGSRLDRALMRRVRAAADALLVGAGTLRAEPVDPSIPDTLANARARRGAPAQPLAVTFSRHLELDPDHRFFRFGPTGTVLFAAESAAPERVRAFAGRARVELLRPTTSPLSDAVAILRSRYGVRRLVVEGGPRLNQALLDQGLVDELFWTIAPKLVGGAGGGLLDGAVSATAIAATLDLVSLFEHGAELFARYRVGTRSGQGIPRPDGR